MVVKKMCIPYIKRSLYREGFSYRLCRKCKGTGVKVAYIDLLPDGMGEVRFQTCDYCAGLGFLVRD